MSAAAEAAAIVADVFDLDGDDRPTGRDIPIGFTVGNWITWSRDVLAWYDAEVAEGVRKPVTVPRRRLDQRVGKACREGRFVDAGELIRVQVARSFGIEDAA